MTTYRRQLPRRIYPLRALGMALGGIVVAVVLLERQAQLGAWLGLAMIALVWPHLAYLRTRLSAQPYRTEGHNLLIDSALAAALVPLMHFNLLPSVLLVTLVMVDNVTTGIRGLWARALVAMLAAGAASTLLTGLHWEPETSMRVMIACLPVMVLHTMSVSAISYQMIRKMARQNLLLDELGRIDALTGLFGRRHWQEQAEAALRHHHTSNEPACMLILDIDHFKEINDTYGHTVGDEVIRAVAHVVRGNVRAGDCAGRYGGDEFAIVLPGIEATHTLAIAQRIRAQTEGVRVRSLPDMRITCSIGVAAANRQHNNLRAWIDAADTALYTAKNAGRNQVACFAQPVPAPAPCWSGP